MNITYLFGAGASAKAIPIVNNSSNSFDLFIDYINNQFTPNAPVSLKRRARIGEYKMLIQEAKSHISLDTYAKKLFLQGDESKLHLLKQFMSVFYLHEQFNDPNIEKHISARKCSSETKEALYNFMNTPRDNRYDAFLAGVLSENHASLQALPEEISIISWNYDVQVELAMNEYTKVGARKFDLMYDPVKESPIADYVSPRFIKLNGSCAYHLHTPYNDKTELYDPLKIEVYTDLYNDQLDIRDITLKLIDQFAEINDISTERTFINFAWEKNSIAENTMQMAGQIMEKADGLVIIGYSFPLFNRDIDKQIFSKLNIDRIKRNSRIYIQSPTEEEFLRIKSRIKGICKGLKPYEGMFEYIPDIEQFHLPFETFDQAI
jgi:hypothetical protein